MCVIVVVCGMCLIQKENTILITIILDADIQVGTIIKAKEGVAHNPHNTKLLLRNTVQPHERKHQ